MNFLFDKVDDVEARIRMKTMNLDFSFGEVEGVEARIRMKTIRLVSLNSLKSGYE